MKRFVVDATVFVFAIISIVIITAFGIPINQNDYLMEFTKKMERIKNTPGHRIIIIGGSNAAFGLDSKRIHQETGYNVVNMGLQAGLGIKFTLASSLPYIRKGDIVIMDVEYGNYFNNGAEGNSDALSKLMTLTKMKWFKALDFQQKINALAGLPRCSGKSLKRLFLYPKRKTWDNPSPKPGGVYSYVASGFNEYGDEVSHWTLKPERIPDLVGNGDGWVYDEEFAKWFYTSLRTISQKAMVINLPPALAMTTFKGEEKQIDKLAGINAKEGFPYIVVPQSMAIPDNMMYNTSSHCAKDGVDLNTSRIIKIIKRVIETREKHLMR